MFPTLDLGPFVLPTAGIVYLLGAWLALSAVEWAARRLRLDVEATYGVAFAGLAGGFVGARLVFVALHWPAYAANPLSIVWPLNTGYSTAGGLLVGTAVALIVLRSRQLPPIPTLDALLPGLLVGLIAASLADFLAGPGYGTTTAVPWGIVQFGVRRHAVQLYEIVAALLALGVWRGVVDGAARPGRAALLAMIVYSSGRLLVEAFRANAPLLDGGYRLVQIASLGALVGALLLLALADERADAPPERP